jgi:hypothetical protein
MSETTAEYKVKTNTVILTEESDGINSKDYWGYALTPFLFPDKVDEREIVIGVKLTACRGNHTQANIDITTFYGEYDEACVALQDLLEAIHRGDRTWDVRDHNSNL